FFLLTVAYFLFYFHQAQKATPTGNPSISRTSPALSVSRVSNRLERLVFCKSRSLAVEANTPGKAACKSFL
ncbi:MAG TPA: hypothetical protein PKE54_24030, partial [Candidatus Obscuribacter sp.]|nr:hypothetical protein [Candidatus Obscuribacter sp.]